jgi:hypothetical protein
LTGLAPRFYDERVAHQGAVRRARIGQRQDRRIPDHGRARDAERDFSQQARDRMR